MKRSSIILVIALASTALVAACSQGVRREQAPPGYDGAATESNEAPANKFGMQESITLDSAPPPAMRVPGISPRAAPGVAFSYRYAFVLPDEVIAGVQEQHAAACEKLGPTQCRITGMRYSLIDEDRVQAQLNFKLAPELARQFGKDGIAAVEKARGKLVDAAIEGQDVGQQITESQRRSADLSSELRRIEARIASGGLGDRERTELQQQAERLRAQIKGEGDNRVAGEERLANTPMTYNYSGAQGFSLGGDPFGDAARTGWNSFVTMGSFVLLAVGVAIPWLVLLALLIMLWRSAPVRRLRAAMWNPNIPRVPAEYRTGLPPESPLPKD